MKIFAIIIGMALSTAALTVGCHMFEDPYEDLPKDCPLNSGYPCPCDPSDGECDDGSACLYWGSEDDEGFCSAECDGSDDKEACADTLGYGVQGHCFLDIGSDKYCVVVCEADGHKGECPPGLECLKTDKDYRVCYPPEAEDSEDVHIGDDDDDDNASDDDDDDDDECECEEGEIQCGDNNDLLFCNDGCNWTSYLCTYICDYNGYSEWTGECSYSADIGNDVCWCY